MDTSHNTRLPEIRSPVERKSDAVGLWDYAKDIIIIVIVAKLSAAVGYSAGRFTPNAMLPKSWRALQVVEAGGRQWHPLATIAAAITGSIGGYFEMWKRWREEKGKQLGVRDIHQDIYTELDPGTLKGEVQQNQRIQDGIKALLEKNAPRGSHAQAMLKDSAPDAAVLGR